ncbi:MAG: hypothetical protein IJL73_06045 [Lachnospiraceae bacterium]|nr:hypothetical protein [Lachnospiraceae bacterium]
MEYLLRNAKTKTKKKWWLVPIISGAVLIIVITIIAIVASHRWRPLKNAPGWSWMKESSVQKIRLREYPTSPFWAVSEDDDLIQSWTDFLAGAEIKWKGFSIQILPEQGGGAAVIELFTDKDCYSVEVFRRDGEDYIVKDHIIYAVNGNALRLFEQTFSEILNRGGAATPWD